MVDKLGNRSKCLFASVCLAFLCVSGCEGCRSPFFPQSDAKNEKEKLTKAERFEFGPIQSLPASGEPNALYMKPGHWHELHQTCRANLGDESVTLVCESATLPSKTMPSATDSMRRPLSFARSAALARGQRKLLSYEFYLPSVEANLEDEFIVSLPQLRVTTYQRGFGGALAEKYHPVIALKDYQNVWVVLSETSDRYQFLNGLSCVVWPSTLKASEDRIIPFRIAAISEAEAAGSLPNRLSSWTATSHILWNDFNAQAITENQQNAILDWLHFGGQIIVNGPESQAGLHNSFLSPYLPLTLGPPIENADQRWIKFGEDWSVRRWGENEENATSMIAYQTIPQFEARLAPNSDWIDKCEGLVAHQQVGAGRVIMTSMPIAEEAMVRWPGFSSFFNGAVLGRSPRHWQPSPWDSNESSPGGELEWAGDLRGEEMNARLSTRFRLAMRNLGRFDETSVMVDGVRQDLERSAGISVPKLATILKLLIGYFIALVPLNWLVFRLVQRVELAWLAAPVIAIVGAVVVARAVQLDIGFSRSQSTLNVLDLPSGYSRGHLSSFVSLYTSLSTNYAIRYPQQEGILLPFDDELRRTTVQEPFRYEYAASQGNGIPSFPVRSNSTAMLRGECVQDLGRSIALSWEDKASGTILCQNDSELNLVDVEVIAKDEEGSFRSVRIGTLESGKASRTTLLHDTEARGEARTALIREVRERLRKENRWEAGEVALIGVTRDLHSPISVTPVSTQLKEETLVVVRMAPTIPTDAVPDLDLPPIIKEPSQEPSASSEPTELTTPIP